MTSKKSCSDFSIIRGKTSKRSMNFLHGFMLKNDIQKVGRVSFASSRYAQANEDT